MTRPTSSGGARSHAGHLVMTIALATFICLGSAGCDGSDTTPPSSAPTSPDTSVVTPTPTSTPKAVPPSTDPADTASFTVSSAEAFGRFFLKAREYAALTGDAALMRKWTNKTCNTCRTLADGYERQHKAGGSITGQVQFKATRVDRVRLVRNDAAEVVLTGRIGRFVDVDHKHATPKVYPGGVVTYQLALIWSDGRWRMYGMVITE